MPEAARLPSLRKEIQMADEPRNGAEIIAEHLAECTDAKAAIVVDGSADDIIEQMTAAGWTLDERVDYVAGKRIRFIRVPGLTSSSDG